jgi:hypothetical protein
MFSAYSSNHLVLYLALETFQSPAIWRDEEMLMKEVNEKIFF